jgi:hypothetical protein
MPKIMYNPEAANRPFLPNAGIYGSGCDHEADVTVYSVKLAEPGSMEAPFDDKDCRNDTYTVWTFQVAYEGNMVFARSRAQANTKPNSGSKNIAWIENLGFQVTDEFDTDLLVGRKCRVKIAKPRQDKEDPTVWYTGSVVDVYGEDGTGIKAPPR